jgi:hypothetical protein
MKSKSMLIVALPDIEAQFFVAATCCAQDLLFEMRVLESMGLKVIKLIIFNLIIKEPRIYAITGVLEKELGMWNSSKCFY